MWYGIFCNYLHFSNIAFSEYNMVHIFGCSYSLVLRHTIEEVLAACIEAIEPDRVALTSHLRNQVMTDLMEGLNKHNWFTGFDISNDPPMKFSLEQWIKHVKEVQATVFIAGLITVPFICFWPFPSFLYTILSLILIIVNQFSIHTYETDNITISGIFSYKQPVFLTNFHF